jgi:signal transduction histidine kinase
LFWPSVQSVLPDESKAAVQDLQTTYWDPMQSLIKTWQAEPDNADVRSQLLATLDAFQIAAQQAEIRYTSLRAIAIGQVSDTSEGLLLALGVVSLLIVVFVSVAGFSIQRYIRDSCLAEEKTRAALAAEAAATENSHFKDQFLAVMSHELRTPLNAIIGFLGIMGMSGKLDEKNAHMVQRTRANAERLLGLINDILDLSKLESGRMEFVPTTLHPFELVQQWRDQMDVLAKQKNLSFTIEMDDSTPRQVEADEGAITKIVTNLLSNAFKFTAEGGVTLKMRAKDKQWLIEVQDTGIGVPAHMHGMIFESFRQVDNSFKRPYGGTGLGLSIIQHLVKAMDGTIRLESTVGKGSTFFVTLPLKSVQESVSTAQPLPQLT